MKVIYNIGRVKKAIPKAVLVIGIFDGVHRGHQKLIQKAVQRARALKGRTVVLTFHPHPVHVLHPEIALPYIISLAYRLKILDQLKVDICIVQEFTKKFSRLTPAGFIDRYLVKHLHPKEIFVGDDFRFGKDRVGSLQYFQNAGERHGFKVHVVESVKGAQRKIGSTLIRRFISSGQLKQASRLLGRPVSLLGKVVRGESRGTALGYPTANVFPDGEILPPLGVYAVYVRLGKERYKGMANLGRRPSFSTGHNPINIEVHIFHFHRRIYGQEIIIEFIKKIRNEKAFNVKEKLVQQLEKDERKARVILK
ncbi:MAG TPA: bifunctional riboflavin kinase/FAD synthetase [Candidatus Omnitrophota bacterium]|nr:bifunctional riboflavin kinase/FAD synthetase [Candidatus Omnitrophota bacterium]